MPRTSLNTVRALPAASSPGESALSDNPETHSNGNEAVENQTSTDLDPRTMGIATADCKAGVPLKLAGE